MRIETATQFYYPVKQFQNKLKKNIQLENLKKKQKNDR